MRLTSRIAFIVAAPLLIAASQPVRLQPSSPWDVDYAENSCRLIRTFGDGKTLTKLAFESSSPGSVDMLITGRPLATYEESASARFLPDNGKPFDGSVAQTTTGEPAILWPRVDLLPADAVARRDSEQKQRLASPSVRPPPLNLEEEASYAAQSAAFAATTTELQLATRRDRSIILETGPLGAAFKAFNQCSTDSLRDWGVDPQLQARIARPVWAVNPTQWLYEADYPRDMRARGEESQVAVRLLVDAAGKVTKCTSLSHFKEAEFNEITCNAITKRAKFEPAELADGTKVPSYYARRVIFRMAR